MPPAGGYVSERLVATRRRSTGLMIGGVVLASLGTASVIGGAVMLKQSTQHGECSFCELGSGLERMGGTFLAVNGGLMIASGVAMAIAGSWQVPVHAGASGSAPGALTVAVGPGNATLRWIF